MLGGFTCGRVPYTGLPAMTLLSELRSGHRLERPSNATCSDIMYARCITSDLALVYL